jgi:hypothetical protein
MSLYRQACETAVYRGRRWAIEQVRSDPVVEIFKARNDMLDVIPNTVIVRGK